MANISFRAAAAHEVSALMQYRGAKVAGSGKDGSRHRETARRTGGLTRSIDKNG